MLVRGAAILAAAASVAASIRFGVDWLPAALVGASVVIFGELLVRISLDDDSQRDGSNHLTPREEEVGVLITRGLTTEQISTRLRVTQRSALRNETAMRQKLNLASRADIARWFLEHEYPGVTPGKQAQHDDQSDPGPVRWDWVFEVGLAIAFGGLAALALPDTIPLLGQARLTLGFGLLAVGLILCIMSAGAYLINVWRRAHRGRR